MRLNFTLQKITNKMENLSYALTYALQMADIAGPEPFTGDWLATYYNGYIKGVLTSEAADHYRDLDLFDRTYIDSRFDIIDSLSGCIKDDDGLTYYHQNATFEKYIDEEFSDFGFKAQQMIGLWDDALIDCKQDKVVNGYLEMVNDLFDLIVPPSGEVGDYLEPDQTMITNINDDKGINTILGRAAQQWLFYQDPKRAGEYYGSALVRSIFGYDDVAH